MPNTHLGSQDAIEQGFEVQTDIRSGFQTRRTWKGPQAAIAAKEAELIAAGWTTRIRSGAVWELEATIAADSRDGDGGGGTEAPVDQWELLPNVAEKDLLESDVEAVELLPAADVNFLRDCLDGKIDFRNYDLQTEAGTPAFVDTSGIALMIFRYIMHGVKSHVVYQPILRKTQTVSNAYQIPSALANVGYLMTTTQLRNSEAIPVSISNNLPDSMEVVRDDGTMLYYGWLKCYPTITVIAGGKTQLTQEYQWGHWSKYLFPIVGI